jgi:hypothetical protein
VQDKPQLFSTFLMWLLAELFDDAARGRRPRQAEARLLLRRGAPALRRREQGLPRAIEQTVRLIRSKGVGVFFVTQSPKDVPADVLAQLGNRVQHALRAFTPDDAKALKATVSHVPEERGSTTSRRARLPRPEVPGGVRRPGRRLLLHDLVLAEELARCGSGGLAMGIGAHTDIAMPPIWKFGTEEQKQRYLVPGDQGREDRRLGHHRARRRLRRRRHQDARRSRRRLRDQRLEDLHHQRRARRLRRHRGARPTRRAATTASRSWCAREGDGGRDPSRRSSRSWAWHASDTGELAFQDVFVPDENLLGEEARAST